MESTGFVFPSTKGREDELESCMGIADLREGLRQITLAMRARAEDQKKQQIFTGMVST